MKIAILHSGDMEKVSIGGVDRYIKSLILFFEDNTITVFGTTALKQHEIGREYIRDYCGKRYRFIPISDDKRRPLSLFYMMKEFRWLKKFGEYDCIYAQRTEYSIPFVFSRSKHKLIQMIHGSSKYSEAGFGRKLAKIHLFMERLAISIARKTFVILNREEFGVPYYKNRYSRYADRIFYGKNPVDLRIYHKLDKEMLRKRYGIPNNMKIVLFSGRLEDNPKRILLLPQICKRLVANGDNVHFYVIGDGSDKDRLQEAVIENNVKDFFHLVGYVDDPHIIAEYNNMADAAINLSIFEGTCTSILEALACGVPVAATDVGDIRECIFDKYNGIIISSCSEDIVTDSANAISLLLHNKIEMNEVYLKYSGESVVNELKAVIENM